MPDSQRMRSGVSVLTSSSENGPTVEVALANAKKLEADLKQKQQSKSTKNTKHSSSSAGSEQDIMVELTKTFGHIIMKFPKEARENRCVTRLFTNCLYNRVVYYRRAIATRQKKDKNSKEVKATLDTFHGFLAQSIKMLDRIRNRYVLMLTDKKEGSSNSSSSATSRSRRNKQQKHPHDNASGAATESHEESTSAESPLSTSAKEDIVANLYRVYMYLGDLHRYDQSNGKAEEHYVLARSLAPGSGQVYNQLGSVAYNKGRFMESLYYYARCMLVTHEAFTLKQVEKNLQLLEAANFKQIVESERGGGIPMVLKDGLTKDEVKARRGSGSKSCTRYLLKSAFDMLNEVKKQQQLQQQQGTNAEAANAKPPPAAASFVSVVTGKDDKERAEDNLREQMEALLASVRSMFKYAVFAEASVFKMVIIVLFLGQSAVESGNTIIRDMAMQMLLSMGLIVSEYITKKTLKQKIDFGSTTKSPPFVRCLVVFEIIVESVVVLAGSNKDLNVDGGDGDGDRDGTLDNSVLVDLEEKFWKDVVEIGNLVMEVTRKYGIPEKKDDDDDDDESGHCVMKIHEYRELKGFKLFPVANEGYQCSSDMYIEPHAAIEAVIRLSPNASGESQDTKATGSTGGIRSPDEQKAKLHRMLEICRDLASDPRFPIEVCQDRTVGFVMYQTKEDADVAMSVDQGDISHDENDGNNVEKAAEHNSAMDIDKSPDKSEVDANDDALPVNSFEEMNDNDDGAPLMSFDEMQDDEAGDAVVYKPQQTGGPDLLVPAQLLAGTNANGSSEMELHHQVPTSLSDAGKVLPGSLVGDIDSNAKSNKENGVPLPVVPPPPGIGPPPGFGSVSAASQATPPNHGVKDPTMAPIIGQLVGVHNGYEPPNSQNYGQSPLYPDPFFLSQPTVPPPGHAVSGIDLYVDDPSKVRTANPFVPKDYQAQMSTSLYQNSVQQERASSGEGGEGLLPAGLLTSLWMDDSKPSKNPWAK